MWPRRSSSPSRARASPTSTCSTSPKKTYRSPQPCTRAQAAATVSAWAVRTRGASGALPSVPARPALAAVRTTAPSAPASTPRASMSTVWSISWA